MNKKKILVVIDMQNDFISGVLGTPEAQVIVPRVAKKIKNFDGDYMFFTMDTHCELDYLDTREGRHLPIPHCIKYSDGWKLASEVFNGARFSNCLSQRSLEKSDFVYPRWKKIIRKLFEHEDVEFEVVGLVTDICVISNVFALRKVCPEVEITVDASCCAGTTPEAHKAALTVMKSCQINVINEDE